jgi:hypothetical protein
MITNLEQSLRENPRPVFVLYHNPLLEHVVTRNGVITRIAGAREYSIFSQNGAAF